jgi:hypothetical protein
MPFYDYNVTDICSGLSWLVTVSYVNGRNNPMFSIPFF